MKDAERPETAVELHPQFKLWLSTEKADGVFGDGRLRLLEAIKASGTLTDVAQELGISYRKAWGDLKKTEERLGTSLVYRTRGGRGGGKTTLTTEGERWLIAYAKFHNEVAGLISESFSRHFGDLK